MNTSRFSWLVLWAGTVLLAVGGADAPAYETYSSGCVNCHPGFQDDEFGEGWLHEWHLDMVDDCNLCHVTDGDDPKVGIEDPDTDRGCVGCHGRLEDMGSDNRGPGLGAGLAQHHTNTGESDCTGCHDMAKPNEYTPVGEDTLPPFYDKGLALENDPCIDFLDNDGDTLYDEEDPDCLGAGGAPTADPNGPYTGDVDVAVPFDGTGSSDDGTIVAYDWDFGDGGTGTGATVSHTYTLPGDYTVTLTVTDDDGLTDTASTTAVITGGVVNQPPVADPDGPYMGDAGVAVLFDATGSSDDGTIVAYDWNFGDGGTGTGATVSHTYASSGNYTVTLTVTDDGGLTDTDTTTALITGGAGNQPPVADTGGPYSGRPGEEVQFDGTGSFDPDGTIVAYVWDFGDGGFAVGPTPTHTYTTAGNYTVTLTVGDDDGVLESDTTTAEIAEDQPPPAAGDVWNMRVPSSTSPGEVEFSVAIEEFGGIMWFDEMYADGQRAFGIGSRSDDMLFWMDSLGALFYGLVNDGEGTVIGIVFDFRGDRGDDTIFSGEN